MKLFGGESFRRRLDWQWPIVRIGGLVVWLLAIIFVTVMRLARGDPQSGQSPGEIIGMGAIMIAGGLAIVAFTWWIKAVLEVVSDLTGRKK